MALDQSNASGTAGNPEVTNADTVWQSFTCGISGDLSLIRVYRDSFSSSGSITAYLTIYSGEGLGGTVLYGAYVSLSSGGGLKDFWLSEPEAITSGNVYTFALSSATASWYVRTGFQSPNGPYSGGKAGHTGTSFGNVYDLYFETYIDEFLIYVADTATGTDSPTADTGAITNRYVGDAGVGSEAIYAPIWTVTDTGGVDPELGEVIIAPIFPITDTGTATELISRPILDAGAGTDTVAVAATLPTVSDTAEGHETITVIGNTPTPPTEAASGGLDAKHVLRLIYGNDKRNPVRTLDLAETAEGHIFLQSGGFAPESGEILELWSGASIRFEGQKKLAESRDNSKLTVVYDLANGSQAGLSALQRAINRFFLEAKTYQTQFKQNQSVWLEYRWSDSLATLPRPTFGQLSYYYEIYAAKAPKWPGELHNGMLLTGNVIGASLEVTGAPAPEGLEQKAGRAGGTITLHDKGILIASGASSRLHWPSYTSSGLTGEFAVTGWFGLNTTWSSGTKDIFDYYVNASNRIRIQYDADNSRFVITKIVGGTTFTANSSTFAIASGNDVHVQLVQDATTLRLYVNGSQIASVTATATMTDGGLIALGCPATGTIDGVDVILDGWRILPDDLTSTQAGQLYTAELPVKQRNLQVGPPPYFWTKDADNVLDNVDDASRDNYGIIGGVGGDIEAKTRIAVTWSTTYARDIWIGLKAQDAAFAPSDYLWSEFSNLTNQVDANFSGGSYRSGTLTTQNQGLTAAKTGLTSTLLFDRYRVLTRLYANTGISAEMRWRFGANSNNGRAAYHIGKKVAINIDLGPWQLIDLGDVQIEAQRSAAPTGYGINIDLELTGDIDDVIEWSGGGDFVFLLPHPYAKIIDAGNSWSASPYPYSLSIEDGLAYATDTGADFSYVGEPIRPIPQRYNYLFLMQVETSNNEFQSGETATLDIYVTPRYALPGGMVS